MIEGTQDILGRIRSEGVLCAAFQTTLHRIFDAKIKQDKNLSLPSQNNISQRTPADALQPGGLLLVEKVYIRLVNDSGILHRFS
jgi:hypothetical protein